MPLNRDRATFLLPVQKRKMICLLYHILGRRVPAPAVTRPRSIHPPPPPHTAGKSGGPCRGHHAAYGRPGAPAVLVCRAVSRRCLHATWEPFQTDMPLNNRDRATFLLPMQKRKMICLLYHILGRRVPAPAVTRPRSVHPPPPPPHTAGKSGGPCRGHHAAHGRPGAPAVLVCRAVSRRCLQLRARDTQGELAAALCVQVTHESMYC